MAFSQQHARASKDKWTPLFSLSLSLSFVSFFCSLSPSLSLSLPRPTRPPHPHEAKALGFAAVQLHRSSRLVSSFVVFFLLSSSSSLVPRARRRSAFGARRFSKLSSFFSLFSFLFFFLFFSFLFFFFFLFFVFLLLEKVNSKSFLSLCFSRVLFLCIFSSFENEICEEKQKNWVFQTDHFFRFKRIRRQAGRKEDERK